MRIISGGQTGVDEAALRTAKMFGLQTGGWMPPGFITHNGPKPHFAELYGVQEYTEPGYKARTWANVRDSQGTLRIASNFKSRGEICTFDAIQYWNRPYYDVDIELDILDDRIRLYTLCINVHKWLVEKDIIILNIAGNSTRTERFAFDFTVRFLRSLFIEMGFKC